MRSFVYMCARVAFVVAVAVVANIVATLFIAAAAAVVIIAQVLVGCLDFFSASCFCLL